MVAIVAAMLEGSPDDARLQRQQQCALGLSPPSPAALLAEWTVGSECLVPDYLELIRHLTHVV